MVIVAAGMRNLTAASPCQEGASDSDGLGMPHPIALSTRQELSGGVLVPAAFNEQAMRDGLSYVRRASFPAVELTLE